MTSGGEAGPANEACGGVVPVRPTSRAFRRSRLPGEATLGIAPRRRTLGDEPTEALTMASHEPVERVDEWRQSEPAKQLAERPGQLDLGEERYPATAVARDQRAIAEHEPPTFVACLLGDCREQPAGRLVRERKQCQFLASVECGDDPRRPATELSAAGIEQDRPRQGRGRCYIAVRALCHLQNPDWGAQSKARASGEIVAWFAHCQVPPLQPDSNHA